MGEPKTPSFVCFRPRGVHMPSSIVRAASAIPADPAGGGAIGAASHVFTTGERVLRPYRFASRKRGARGADCATYFAVHRG